MAGRPARAGLARKARALSPPLKQVWADNFNGPANGSVSTASWNFETGRGIFDAGEIETMTSSPYNAHLDGQGNLYVLGHGAAGRPDAALTSARIRTRRQFAVGRRRADGDSVHQAAEPGAPDELLAPVSGCWGRSRGRRPERSTSWRMSMASARPRAPCTAETLPTAMRTGRSGRVTRRAAWAAAMSHGFPILLNVSIGGTSPDVQCRCTTPDNQTSSQGR